MTALPGWPAVSGAATFQHIRRSLAGQVVKSAAGTLRKGILPISTSALVTGTATMNVAVGPYVAVLDRNGAVFLPNDGSVNVLLSSAPASGSRWSVVYTKQKESEAPFSDGSSGPIIDKVESTTSATAARALLPTGALELALVQVNAGAANTNAVGVTITQTVPYTAMEGGVVLLRDATDQGAWAPHDGAIGYRLDTNRFVHRVSGAWTGGWLPGDTGWLPMTLESTFWSSFGEGVQYRIVGGVCYGIVNVSRGSWTGTSTFATLPSGARPSKRITFASVYGDVSKECYVNTDGNVQVNAAGTLGITGSFAFPVG